MLQNPIEILKKYWGFSEFKGSQEKIITEVLKDTDVLALLPTGGGKSLCYQVPAMAKDGICIVVSPLVALIQNQVDSLRKKGIKTIALTGGISFSEMNDLLDNCLYGNYKFLYISPERLQQEIVRDRIAQMNVSLIAIDEAHCISQWGNDFRPAYLECAILREICPNTPIIALTATATKKVAADIMDNLQFKKPFVVKDSFSRKNISLKVLWDENKNLRLKQLCKANKKSAIIYVRTRRLTHDISNYLLTNKFSCTFFHGGLTSSEKEKKLEQWLTDKVQIIVATNAFGMGIDKADVGLVVHYQIPDSIENYFQEAGRAGRDEQAAEAILLTNKADENTLKRQFLSVLPDVDFVKLLYKKLSNYFQIAYGEGNDSIFQLGFNKFCAGYKLNPALAYNGLRILDQNSVISLSESFSKKTSIQFTTAKEHLFDYLDYHKKQAPIIQTILRMYGGIFDYETKINTLQISKKTNVSEQNVIATLELLHKDEIIEYKAQHNDLEITFLVPREDDRTINVFGKKIKSQKELKVANIESMLTYINTNTVCRSKQLLLHFGEKDVTDCGICDVCLSKPKIDNTILKLVESEIISSLKKRAKTSRELTGGLTYKENVVLSAIQNLLEEEHIFINAKNEYQIN
ncbi:MAG: RecQ family ATP-dependent DNA helicase [Cellulophaga sp.]